MQGRQDRWEAHPVTATAIKAVAYLSPILVSVGAAILVSRVLPTPRGLLLVALWWLALTAVAVTVAIGFERVARRLLPIAVMYKLSLIFPDEAPARYRVAAAGSTTRALEREMEALRELGTVDAVRERAAERILRLVAALAHHDPRTRGHAERVAVFSDMIGDELELDAAERDRLRWSAILHDVGKLAVHRDILNTDERPTTEEWEALKQHPLEGARLTAPLHDWLGDWSLCIEQHHERFDGAGYPHGLAGVDISYGARIVAVADAYDAITAVRSYGESLPPAKARQELASCAGSQFDPAVVRAFLNISLGRLRWAMGPLSWLTSVPVLRQLGGSSASGAAATAAIAGAAAVIGVATVSGMPSLEPLVADTVVAAVPTSLPVAAAVPTPSPSQPESLPIPDPVASTPPSAPPVTAPEPAEPSATRTAPTPPPGPVATSIPSAAPVTPPVPTSPPAPTPTPTPTAGPTPIPLPVTVPPPPPPPPPVPAPVVTAAPAPAPAPAPVLPNQPPTFVPGGDVTVLEDAGAQSLAWATSITPGPPSEAGQGVTFIVANDNPALFASVPSISPAGTLAFTPAADAVGSATVTVSLVDDGTPPESTSPQTFTITLAPVNDGPSFTGGGNVTLVEDAGPQTLTNWATAVSPGPADEAGQVVSFLVSNDVPTMFTTQPDVAADGTLTFEVAPSANGVATVTVVAKDDGGTADGGADTALPVVFTIDVTSVNDAPSHTAGPDSTGLEDSGPVTVVGWATDIDPGAPDEAGQTLTFTTSTDNDGLFASLPVIDGTTGTLTYEVAADANGAATVSVSVGDDGTPPATSPIQTFTIAATPVNDAPSFLSGPNVTVAEDNGPMTVLGWATAMKAGPADESGQVLSFDVVGNDNPSLFVAAPVVDPVSGNLMFEAAAQANGVARIQLQLSDDGGTADGGVDTSSTASFSITVDPVEDAPSFTAGGPVAVAEDSGAYSAPWASGFDPGGGADETSQTVASYAVTGATPALYTAGGQPAIAPDGTLTFTPAPDANGADSLSVTVTDSGGATSTAQSLGLTITSVNDAPVFTAGPAQNVLETAGPQTVPGWAKAIGPGGGADEVGQTPTLAFTVTNDDPTLFAVQPAVAPDGTLTYDPAGTPGVAFVTVRLADGGGTANGGQDTSADSVFSITMGAVNDPPTFVAGADQTVLEDAGPQTVPAWASSISPGPPDESGQLVSFNILSNSNPGLFLAAPDVADDGTLTWEAAAEAFGTATITIEAQDDGGTAGGGADRSVSQSFDITVTAVNDAPSFTKGADVTVPENSGAFTQVGWATAILAGPANESGQGVGFTRVGNTTPGLFTVEPELSPSGELSFTVAPNVTGATTVSFVLGDDGGTADGGVDTSPAQAFTITVTDVNDAPSFQKGGDVLVGQDSGAYSEVGWATSITMGPANESGQSGTFLVSGFKPHLFDAAGPPQITADGTLTFTPAAGAAGTTNVTVVLQDDGGTADGGQDTSPPESFVITLNGTPTGQDDFHKTGKDVTLSVAAPGVLANDADPEGDPLAVDLATVDTSSLVGTLTAIAADGSFEYEPLPGYVGDDQFSYRVTDGYSTSGVVLVTIDIVAPAVVISEFAWGDIHSGGDFVELYNRGATPANILGWELHLEDDDTTDGLLEPPLVISGSLLTPGPVTELLLPPGGHYLFVKDGELLTPQADATFTTNQSDGQPFSGGLWDGTGYVDRAGNRLRPGDGTVPAAALVEGTGVPPTERDTGNGWEQSYERLGTGALGNCQDLNDNSLDFTLNVVAPSPQNSLAAPVACGSAATPAGVDHLVISEFATDGLLLPDADWVELFNPTGRTISLVGLQLWIDGSPVVVDLGAGDVPLDLGGALEPGDHLLIAGRHYPVMTAPWFPAGMPTADHVSSRALMGDQPLLQLVNTSTGSVIDEVRVDNGTGPPTVLPVFRGQMLRSVARAGGGCQDADLAVDDWVHRFRPKPESLASGSAQTPCPKTAPTANDDAYTLAGTTGSLVVPAATGVLANDGDFDGDPISIQSNTTPANAAAFTFNPDGSFTYTPDAAFTGVDTFTYTITDGTNPVSATVTIFVPP